MSDPLPTDPLILAMRNEILQWRAAANEVRSNVDRICYASRDLDGWDGDRACEPFDRVTWADLPPTLNDTD